MATARHAIWGAALAIWFLCSGTAWLVAERHSDRIENEAKEAVFARAEVGAEAIEQSLLRLLEAIQGLHELAQSRHRLIETGEQSGASLMEAQLATVAQAGRFGVLQVAIIGSNGWSNWSSVPDWTPVYVGDREHFRIHENGQKGLFVSTPLIGRTSRQWSVQFTRPLQASSGEFAGVAVVAVDPIRLSRDLAQLEFGERGTTLLMRNDGTILGRDWDPERVLGHTFARQLRTIEALAKAPSGRLRVPDSIFDGRPKLLGYRSVEGAPLVAVAALDEIQEMAPTSFVRPALRSAAAGISGLMLAVIGLAVLWDIGRRTQAKLAVARTEREAALERLAHAQQMEALGRLAGGVAHDFNNVMQAVLGGGRLIKRRPEDSAGVERLAQMVIEAAERGASITRRLLSFARRGELRAQVVDLNEMLAGLNEVLSHTLGANIHVRVQASPDLPKVLVDCGQLETALVNLAINSRDAIGSKGGLITLAATPEVVPLSGNHRVNLKPGSYIRLSVVDNGPGMDAETLVKAVEPFFTTKPKGQGTGLGLAMAKGFAEQSGGTFQIQSQPGQGTTVTIWIPQAPPSACDGKAVAADTARRGPTGTKARVLLVDDEPHVRAVLATALREQGHSVREASCGDMALIELKRFEADVLVTDLAMPGMNGLELIREARSLRPRLPSLLITGFAGDASTDQFSLEAKAGPLMLLRKPIDYDELEARVATLANSVAPI